jgi:ABC-type nickel/cobalt efflux system permease component RcnA
MPHTALGLLAFGFVLGLRHALDVDHLAAVSTMVTQRRSLWSSSLVGVVWGLGHTAALLAMAVLVIGLHAEIPARLARGLELAVAVMLIGLGLNLLWTLRRGGTLHVHRHEHGGRPHVHLHVHAPADADAAHHHPVRAGRRPFVVGLVHGLAGSAALMLAVLATIPSPALALAYVATFGCGSIGGMVAMSALLGMPLALAAERFARAETAIRFCAAVGSVSVGVLLAWKIAGRAGFLA